MPLRQLIADLATGTNREGAFEQPPFAAKMGFRYQATEEGVMLIMPFRPEVVGAPGRLHGGSIAALLEFSGLVAAVDEAIRAYGMPDSLPRPINVTVEYLREGQLEEDTYAIAKVTRLGRRVANIRAEAWQVARDRLIATADMNMVMDGE